MNEVKLLDLPDDFPIEPERWKFTGPQERDEGSNRPAQANPAKTLKLDFRLIPPSPPASGAVTIETGVPVPSLGRQATAVAEIVGGDKDQKSRAKLRNIAIIGGAILLLILVA